MALATAVGVTGRTKPPITALTTLTGDVPIASKAKVRVVSVVGSMIALIGMLSVRDVPAP